ncbi:hypothetical protein INT44_003840 [Umbelopsis vinacea]|uniref:phosphatidylinositol-3,4,5-trisphosphate 3-phosphatase n=1 Tax=Umbelopsis vinacea TaxID=44442 RepID=A0A8H7QC72_9FUNG|nr:hypothetical protein INT44_003840 [Umbelopsis vinacea]
MTSSNEGSDLFISYEQDFGTICDAIRSKIEKQIPNQKQRKATVRAAEREIDEADEIIAQMEMEILNIPTASRTRLQTKLRLFKSEFEKTKRDLRRATTQVPSSSNREELFGGLESGDGDLDASTVDQRSRLLTGTDRLGESSRRLQDSHRLALETENVGINILGTLKGQRETILRSRDTLTEADSHIDKASKTLKGMARRYLDKHHPQNYKVYNLRSEKGYTNDLFEISATFAFKDHQAPTLRTVIQFCEDASDYLALDPENVVVVHCKAGKGRTGVMVAALLLKLKVANDPNEAIQMYARERTHDGRGITIPSQRRYVFYFDSFLHDPWSVKNREIRIKKMVLIGHQSALNKDGKCLKQSMRMMSREEIELVPEDELIVESDFIVVLWRTRVAYKSVRDAQSNHRKS